MSINVFVCFSATSSFTVTFIISEPRIVQYIYIGDTICVIALFMLLQQNDLKQRTVYNNRRNNSAGIDVDSRWVDCWLLIAL